MFSSSSMLVLKRNCMEWSFRRDHKGIRMKAMWHDNDTSLLLGFTHRQWWHLHINETFLNERLNNIQNIQNRSVQKQVLPTKCLALTCFHIQRQIEYLTCPLLGVLSRTRILKILYYVPVHVNFNFSIWVENCTQNSFSSTYKILYTIWNTIQSVFDNSLLLSQAPDVIDFSCNKKIYYIPIKYR